MLSFSTPEEVVRNTVSAISSSIAKVALLPGLHAADVPDRRLERAGARQAAVIAGTFDDAPIPGADARRNGNDRKALRDLGGAGERGFRKSDYRPVEGFAQCRQARVAERGEDDGVVIGEVVRYANQGGLRADH